MKIAYNWLKEYIDLPLSPEETSKTLTSIGLEVDSMEKMETIRGGLAGVVVGHVLTCEKHPDADKLSVTTVDLGTGEPVQIVCGAPNVAAGQKVPVATVGTTLYPTGAEEGFTIKKSKIRGIESHGMICAEDELGLGDSHAGIMELDPATHPGTPAKEYFQIEEDYQIEIGLTPNRIDAGSHYGVARDLAASLISDGRPTALRLPSVADFSIDNNSNPYPVEVMDTQACPRYMGLTISGVKVAPSPEWLQNRLRSIGQKPINNVVDVTNFVLNALGQPLHAFDADKIDGRKVIVQTCPEGTPFVTLDGVERKLSAEDLMICSATRPLCIAGVFGGLDSGVTEATTNVFLESAYFNPVTIRKTARRHGLNTDASFHYERGIDPNMVPFAQQYAALLIRELAGGQISSQVQEVYPKPFEPFRVELDYAFTNRLIGKEIPKEQIKTILKALEINILSETEAGLSLEVPPYRVDVTRQVDVIEEVLRIYGYNNVEIPLRVHSTLTYAKQPDRDAIQNSISNFLTANGFNEIMSNSLTKASYYQDNATYPIERCVRILNPLSIDLNVMRQTLLYNALEAAQLNANHRNSDLKLYEFGNCYFYDEAKKPDGGLAPYSENQYLSVLIAGNDRPASWNIKSTPTDFFTLKSFAEKLLKRFGFDLSEAQTDSFDSPLFSEAVEYKLRGKTLFHLGVLDKKLCRSFDQKTPVYFLEMNADTLLGLLKNHQITVKELAKYPEVRRDLALLVDRSVSFAQLKRLAFSTEKKLLKSVTLFDVYEGDKLPEGKKSYALSFVLQDPERTMTDSVTDSVMNKIAGRLEKETGAQIRG
ncbi:MAG: phenylalanine--tRNA ligase subunit beta [Rikenellaceae bacterium]|jgi:phenylalanyl-tRNA synthetase beta chain|nr:phenylalanine--tRNA ligase subunit beta [Rikenellaceae bacterium]